MPALGDPGGQPLDPLAEEEVEFGRIPPQLLQTPLRQTEYLATGNSHSQEPERTSRAARASQQELPGLGPVQVNADSRRNAVLKWHGKHVHAP